ncbi:hypothetical protein GKZ68_00380 [Hymenobacter sp. BRD128]|uniref:hypothetical protein n=1 Tax=Hymenobacter sp. BRD128 TaxID=2675878 RepID=UPI001566AD59|nr:hypothetical protein [Hymenobacter sp. BRD128]QKG55228.1 hypothetical protein GKZ68_00380 [Hymenobacter sp. BRD128]
MPRLATPPAAPAQGAAPTATEQRARLVALIEQCQARDQAAQRRSCYLAPAPSAAYHDPATDPARWQGFL